MSSGDPLQPTRTTTRPGFAHDAADGGTRPSSALAYHDEISLRDLYLILKRGLPTIAIVAGVVALATFLASTLRPPTFEASATVISSNVAIQPAQATEGTNPVTVDLRVDFDTYATIATGTEAFEAVRAAVIGATGRALSFSEFGDAFTLERVTGANASSLTVDHDVTWPDPDEAAALANAWASYTVETVRRTLVSDLEPALAQASAAMESMSTLIDSLDAARTAFEIEDVSGVERRLSSTNERIARLDDDLDVLERAVVRSRARIDALASSIAADVVARTVVDAGIVDLLVRQGVLDSDVGVVLKASSASGDDADLVGDAATLAGRTVDTIALVTLRQLRTDLAGFEAERDQLIASRASAQATAEELRVALATLRSTAADLDRRRDEIDRSLGAVADLEPLLSFLVGSLPDATRLLSQAVAPDAPTSNRAALTTALATVIATLASTLFVFLREAVKDPSSSKPPT